MVPSLLQYVKYECIFYVNLEFYKCSNFSVAVGTNLKTCLCCYVWHSRQYSRGKDKCNGSKCGSEFPPAPSAVCGDATIALYPSCLCAFIAEHRVGYIRAAGTYWGCGDWFPPIFAD